MVRWYLTGLALLVVAIYGLGWLVSGEPERKTYGWVAAAAALVAYLSVRL